MTVGLLIGCLVGWSPLNFFMFLLSLASLLPPKCFSDLKYFAHPHATGVAVYPVLFRSKAGYVATKVLCGWVGAVIIKLTKHLGSIAKNAKKAKCDSPTDETTNQHSKLMSHVHATKKLVSLTGRY